MNLRKDHCRDPDQNRSCTCYQCRRMAGPLPSGPVPDLLVEGRVRYRTRGAEWRQGTLLLNTLPVAVGRHADHALCSVAILIHTTLGNGYLGSRIDEERSKMRYLV